MSKPDMIERQLCRFDDIPNNSMREIQIKIDEASVPVKVLLIKYADQLSCLASKCTQHSVPLSQGVLYKERLRCMADGTCFNVKTGDVEDYPGPDSLPSFNVSVDTKGMVNLKATRQELEATKRLRTELAIKPQAGQVERFERPKGSASMQRPKTSLANRAGSANTRNRIQVIPKEALESVRSKKLPKCLIIGSGAGGLVCMDTLREYGFFSVDTSLITLITQDSQLPYDRQQLSKNLDSNIETTALRDKDYMLKNNIVYETNETVDKIDMDKKSVLCSSGKAYTYDKLVISTGFKARCLPASTAGSDLTGVFTLHSLADLASIKAYYEPISKKNGGVSVCFVGSSFISMESVCYFVEKNCTCTIIGRQSPLEEHVDKQVSLALRALHEQKHVKFVVGCEVEELKGNKSRQLESVLLSDGSEVKCDLCVVAVGGLPCTEFLKSTGVKLNDEGFVVVDMNMRTSVTDVYAVGDITCFPRACLAGPNSKEGHVSISHWGLACQQGRSAALSIVNQTRTEQLKSQLEISPFFSSTMFGKSVRFSGFKENHKQVVFHGETDRFAAFYIDSDNKVTGVCTMDYDPICAIYAELMIHKIEVRAEHVTKDPLDIKKLLLI